MKQAKIVNDEKKTFDTTCATDTHTHKFSQNDDDTLTLCENQSKEQKIHF